MTDQYEHLTERYDQLVRDTLPVLTLETVGRGIEAINELVYLHRSKNWPRAISIEPTAILGMTSDDERVIYRDVGRLGFYHAAPFDQLFQRVSEMISQARSEYNNPEPAELDFPFVSKVAVDKVNGLQRILNDLNSLRSK